MVVFWGVYLVLGGSAWSGGGSAWSVGGCISQHALRQTPLPPTVDRQMPVKILPWPNFVAAGNKKVLVWKYQYTHLKKIQFY